ncbi:polysaccharide pyruvyl transferase family protein [Streptomyces sp. NPDC003032]
MPNKRPLYYLVSPAGVPNFGDELIAATWLRQLGQNAPDADVVLDCVNPRQVHPSLLGLHPRLRLTDTLWQVCLRNWDEGALAAAGVAQWAVANPEQTMDLAEGMQLLLTADVIHLLGGGYINDIWPAYFGLLAGVAAAAERSGARAALTGQGLYPAADGTADLLAELVGSFEVFDVRDQPSAQLVGPRATLTGDDAFLGGAGRLRDGALPEVMVSVQSLLSEVEDGRLLDAIRRGIDAWGVTEVGLLECAPGQDADILALAERVLPVVVRRFSVAEVLADGFPAAPGQTWISTRFHPHLVAAAGGASGVALSVHADYYGTKHRSLADAGSRWHLLDGWELPERPTAQGFSPADLDRLRTAKEQLAARIYG